MKYFVYGVFLAIMTGLMVGLSFVLSIKSQSPNLLALCVFVWALDKTEEDYLILTFLSGLFLDFYSGLIIGSFSMPLIFCAVILRILVNNFAVLEKGQKALPLLLLPFMASFYLLFYIFNWPLRILGGLALSFNPGFFFWRLLISFLYSLVFFYPVYFVLALFRAQIRKFFEKEFKSA